MKKMPFKALLTISLLLISPSAFSGSYKDLLGKWDNFGHGVFEFFDDGTFVATAPSGNFSGRHQVFEEDILTIEVDDKRTLRPWPLLIAHFTISNGTMTLTELKEDSSKIIKTMQRINPATPSKVDKPSR
jgi:hypothetical protein